MITIRIPFQRVPYAYAEVMLSDTEAKPDPDKVMQAAKRWEDAYVAVFGVGRQDAQPTGEAPHPAEAPRQRAQGNGTGVFCPEHNVECRKTSAQYDKDGDRFYHPLPESEWKRLDDGRTAKNHNLYLRQCVDANGNSLDGAMFDPEAGRLITGEGTPDPAEFLGDDDGDLPW